MKDSIEELEEIGGRIRIYRERIGLSQCELADILNTSQQAIALYEKGKRHMKPQFIPDLAKALDIPIGWIFGEEIHGLTQKMYDQQCDLINTLIIIFSSCHFIIKIENDDLIEESVKNGDLLAFSKTDYIDDLNIVARKLDDKIIADTINNTPEDEIAGFCVGIIRHKDSKLYAI